MFRELLRGTTSPNLSTLVGGTKRPSGASDQSSLEEKGRLSNPVTRRLSTSQVDESIRTYVAGSSIDSLARQYSVNRTTVIKHLDRQGVPRRRVVRKMNDVAVAQAAVRYEEGSSLAVVAQEFKVHDRTLAREFRRVGVPVRLRRGWTP
jgi:AraC-like DNA-binding protein